MTVSQACACVFIVLVAGGCVEAGVLDAVECAPQSLVVDTKINDKSFMQSQINCILGRAKCDEFGQRTAK